MKKILGLILALCIVFAFTADAFAGSKPKIVKQPETATTSKKGTVSFSVKVSGTVSSITWHFIDPVSGKDYTGKTLSKSIKGVRVSNPNGKKITLSKVPESMHGWTVYCHINGNAYKVDSDRVMLLVYGMDPPAATEQPSGSGNEEKTDEKPEEKSEKKPDDDSEPANLDAVEFDEGELENRTIAVTSTAANLRKLDTAGHVVEGDPVSRLEFQNTGSFIVSSEEAIKSWTINGVRYEPSQPVQEIRILNVTGDMSIDLNIARATAASAEVDESHMCKVTCEGCTFTYLRSGLRSVTEGEVPAGAPIRISADSPEHAANGYSVNGGEAQNQGLPSFQLTVTEDVTIVAK